jgi:hypothetical protein
LQYSYERWANGSSDIPEVIEPVVMPETPMPQKIDNLKILEEDISFDLKEGMEAYRQYRHTESEPVEIYDTISPESDWDELAKVIADHVLGYMVHHPVQNELNQLRGKIDDYYRDNRAMAEHIQHLVLENHQLRVSVSACGLEAQRYHNVLGNLYLKL